MFILNNKLIEQITNVLKKVKKNQFIYFWLQKNYLKIKLNRTLKFLF